MANKDRGEVDLVVGEKTYTLRPGINAMAVAQQHAGKPFGEIMKSLTAIDVIALRELVWMLLKKHHGKEFPTAEKVGDLIDDAGVMPVIDAVAETFNLNFSALSKGGSNGSNPPVAQDQEPASTGE